MVSCTTKQHWELLLDAEVVIGEARDNVVDNTGEDEIVLVRGDDTDTGEELGVAECDRFAGFGGENVNFAVLFVVPGRGAGRVTEVLEREYGDSMGMFEDPGV